MCTEKEKAFALSTSPPREKKKYHKECPADISECLNEIWRYGMRCGLRLLDIAADFDISETTVYRWRKRLCHPCEYYYASIRDYARWIKAVWEYL